MVKEDNNIDIVLERFPGLIEVLDGKMFFIDRSISTSGYKCSKGFMERTGQVYFFETLGDPLRSVFIRFQEDKDDRDSDYMTLPKGIEISEEKLMILFGFNLNVRYYNGDSYERYDRASIERTHTIKNIINE